MSLPTKPRRRPTVTPLFAELVQQKLKAQAPKPRHDPATVGRRRCDNCGQWMKLTSKNRKQKRFCGSDDPGAGRCKDEFHQNGGTAFGPLKARIEKVAREITIQCLAELITSPTFREQLRDIGVVLQ